MGITRATGRETLDQTVLVHRPQDLLYALNHVWTRIINDKTVKVGLSKYACECIKQFCESNFLVFYPSQIEHVGTKIERMQTIGVIETKLLISFDLISPLSGRIKKINTEAVDRPYIISKNPEETWFVEIEPTHLKEEAKLLFTPDQYRKICEKCDGITASSNEYIFDKLTHKWYVSPSKLLIKKCACVRPMIKGEKN